jgi:glycosyltransferase involved in cell wall biosynthesis
MAVREMLKQLAHAGYDVQVLGATIFDAERGTTGLGPQAAEIRKRIGQQAVVQDGPLQHVLYITRSPHRSQMLTAETHAWHSLYQQALDRFRPDIVYFYGGQANDLLIPMEARLRGIPSAFYLANGNYSQARWARDVSLILTDSQATADMYRERLNLSVTPVGPFIDASRVVAEQHTRERVLFVNPKLEKGAGIVIRLALMLEKLRPDIVFEVVESRGAWAETLKRVTSEFGQPRESLDNVVVTPTTSDMRPVYGRARLVLAPSLWWESGARVVIEAMLNGIPAVVSAHGGMPEMIRDAGFVLRFGPQYHRRPYNMVPPVEELQEVAGRITSMYDDAGLYRDLCEKARRVAEGHHMQASTKRLLAALAPLAAQRAGDADSVAALRKWHRHGLDDRALPPPGNAPAQPAPAEGVEAP